MTQGITAETVSALLTYTSSITVPGKYGNVLKKSVKPSPKTLDITVKYCSSKLVTLEVQIKANYLMTSNFKKVRDGDKDTVDRVNGNKECKS